MCTIGHTGTGSCICSKCRSKFKSDDYPIFEFNPDCPVSGHSAAVNSVDLSPDGQHFVSGSDDRLVKIWDIETGAEVRSFVGVR